MTNTKKKNSMLVNGSILAVTAIIVRVIGLLYRIPVANIIGDEGNGSYGSSFAIYSFILVISAQSMPTVVGKLVAERKAFHKHKEAHRIFKTALVYSTSVGLFFSVLLYLTAPMLAKSFALENSVYALRALTPSVFIFSIIAVFRGYFQGMHTMVPTAISQVIEQIFNATFSIILAYILCKSGPEFGAAGSSLGTSFGALSAGIFLVFIYMIYRPKQKILLEKDRQSDDSIPHSYYIKIFFFTSVPIILGSTTNHLTNIVEMFMFNNALLFHGYSEAQRLIMYGMLATQYQIIIFFPISVATVMATASVPSVSKSVALQDTEVVIEKVRLVLRTVLLVTIPSMFGIFMFSQPIIELLFPSTKYVNVAASILQVGSPTVVLYSVSIVSVSLLHSLGLLNIPLRNGLIGLVVKIVSNTILLFAFNYNVYGAVISNILFGITVATLNYGTVRKHLKIKPNIYKHIVKPVMASLIMAGAGLSGFYVMQMVIESRKICFLLILPICILVYIVSVIKLKAITKDEMKKIPGLQRFIK